MQVAPQLRYFVCTILLLATVKLASSQTITGDLPPSSRHIGVRVPATVFSIILATRSEPVKKILSNLCGEGEGGEGVSGG